MHCIKALQEHMPESTHIDILAIAFFHQEQGNLIEKMTGNQERKKRKKERKREKKREKEREREKKREKRKKEKERTKER